MFFCFEKQIVDMTGDMEQTFLHVYFYPSPVSPKEGEAVCLLAEKMIIEKAQKACKTFRRLPEDPQEADKLVLPALGGDRGGR